MSATVVVIEPPFLEPSLSRPEAWRIAAMVHECGFEATVLDLNLALYRGLIQKEIDLVLNGLEPATVQEAFARSFFIDPSEMERMLRGEATPSNDLSPELRQALVGQDYKLLERLRSNAVTRFCGRQGNATHEDYVRDQELLNSILDINILALDRASHLSFSDFKCGVNPLDPTAVLDFARDTNNVLYRLYDLTLESTTATCASRRVLVVISQEQQVLPGIVLARWLHRRFDARVTLTGDFLDIILSQYFTHEMFDFVESTLAYRFEYGGHPWLLEQSHPFVVTKDQREYPPFNRPALTLAGPAYTIAGTTHPRPIGPFPVASISTTSRCYWSKCAFCVVAANARFHFSQASPLAMPRLLSDLELSGIFHAQFMDYALPPVLFKALAHQGGSPLRWAAQIRFEKSFVDSRLFDLAHGAGCVALSWGFESGDPQVLHSARKGGILDPKEKEQLLRCSSDAGISNHLFIITGLPNETEQQFMETCRFLERNIRYIDSIEAYAFQLRPGTHCHKYPGAYGLVPTALKWPWQSLIPYTGTPSPELAQERARIIDELFGQLPAASGCNDLLEGHITLNREVMCP